MTPLSITRRDTDTGPVLHVAGELDFAQAPLLRSRVEELALTRGTRLTLDLSGLELCDSSGITVLLAAHQHAEGAGARLVLSGVPARLLRTLAVTGLDQVFTLSPPGAASVA